MRSEDDILKSLGGGLPSNATDEQIKAEFNKDFALLDQLTSTKPVTVDSGFRAPAPPDPEQREMRSDGQRFKSHKSPFLRFMSEIEIVQRLIYMDNNDYLINLPIPFIRALGFQKAALLSLIIVQYGNEDMLVRDPELAPGVYLDPAAWKDLFGFADQAGWNHIRDLEHQGLVTVRKDTNHPLLKRVVTLCPEPVSILFMTELAKFKHLVMTEAEALKKQKEADQQRESE